jgi:hypothetical protein
MTERVKLESPAGDDSRRAQFQKATTMMENIPQQTKERKYAELQRRGCSLTKRIRAAELRRNPAQVEGLFRRKAVLIARLRGVSRVD